MKAEVDKPDINKLISVLNCFNNFKIKVDHLDVDKLKAVPVDFKKIEGVVSKQAVKNTKLSKLNTKVNNVKRKLLMHLL